MSSAGVIPPTQLTADLKIVMENNSQYLTEQAMWHCGKVVGHVREEVREKVDHDKIWLLIKNFTKTLLNHFIEKQSVPKVVGPNIEISIK